MSPKAEMEFAVEVEILGRVRHKNLLGLRGFYAGGDERLIVYDYMQNHSLINHLHGQLAADLLLDWPRRISIAIGSAEGIAYLHHEAKPHIIHRDIKASNVLLDSEFQAKVADFGFAKLIPEGVSHLTTRVKGTLGYLAPEYAMWGKVSESCDVYSFGILLLEIISAKKPIEKLPGGVKRDIVQWATLFVEKGNFDRIADPRLRGRFDRTQLKSVVMIAMRCTDSNPDHRPSMMEVVEWLKGGGIRRKKVSVSMLYFTASPTVAFRNNFVVRLPRMQEDSFYGKKNRKNTSWLQGSCGCCWLGAKETRVGAITKSCASMMLTRTDHKLAQ
ncbi:hypothetical protein HHK36_028797 [Tetracentron sinense]|uniref:Protein kinase domain-containing protein n=1 Tax=Tetracentron sinense TaxID=13715 RepID=A0A835D3S2_TETSI|nr:hypothetical protein HHK36_028797 [Tetracentron sinense]